MAYDVRFKTRAAKEVRGLPRQVQEDVTVLRRELSIAPRRPGFSKLEGARRQPMYRARIGDYRVVFTIDDASTTVWIVAVGPRSDVYRGLGR